MNVRHDLRFVAGRSGFQFAGDQRRHSFGPLGALLDPLTEQLRFILFQRIALGRHVLVIIGRQDGRSVQRASIRFPGHERRAVVSALQRAGSRVQAEVAFGFFRPVAADAVEFEDRLDLLLEIDFFGCAQRGDGIGQKNSCGQ